MNNKEIYNYLIEILIKKAEGFFYTEELEEYEKTQNKSILSKNHYENLSFFENNVIVSNNIEKSNDTLKLENEKKQDNTNLIMVKKKITKHYIPPDMLAIKILFETIKEKMNNDDLNNISDDELLKLKDTLIGELLNENKQNK